jgi:plasmid stabilization system protein ParE
VSEFKVFVLPDAEAEITAAFTWYLERNAHAADAFRTEVFQVVDSLTDAPTKWKLNEDGTRRRVLRHFPYTVYFEVEGDAVFILAVAHQRRAPGYWQDR